jgi:hypothetical protein
MQWNIDKILLPYLDDPQKMLQKAFNLDLDEADQRMRDLRNYG